jgi:hypothetical protein
MMLARSTLPPSLMLTGISFSGLYSTTLMIGQIFHEINICQPDITGGRLKEEAQNVGVKVLY